MNNGEAVRRDKGKFCQDLLRDLDEEDPVDDVEHVQDGAHGGRLDLDRGQPTLCLSLNKGK